MLLSEEVILNSQTGREESIKAEENMPGRGGQIQGTEDATMVGRKKTIGKAEPDEVGELGKRLSCKTSEFFFPKYHH